MSRQVFSVLDEENNGFISMEELHKNMLRVLQMYSKKARPDSSSECSALVSGMELTLCQLSAVVAHPLGMKFPTSIP